MDRMELMKMIIDYGHEKFMAGQSDTMAETTMYMTESHRLFEALMSEIKKLYGVED